MMKKLFYNPRTLRIMGMSSDEKSLSFPFVEIDEKYHSTKNMRIEKDGRKFKLIINKK